MHKKSSSLFDPMNNFFLPSETASGKFPENAYLWMEGNLSFILTLTLRLFKDLARPRPTSSFINYTKNEDIFLSIWTVGVPFHMEAYFCQLRV